jgi:hypothetical protein
MGWITCDNASNNDTMFKCLTTLLQKRRIKIKMDEQRIQYIYNLLYDLILMLFDSCFPHIVNLACKAALAAITDLTYVDDTIDTYSDYDPSFTITKDCIATACSLVNAVNYILIHSCQF